MGLISFAGSTFYISFRYRFRNYKDRFFHIRWT